jgi:hypothetical protein
LGTRQSKSGQNSAKWGTGGAVASNKNNKLRLQGELRTKGSWVQILPGAPHSQGLADMQALFICDGLSPGYHYKESNRSFWGTENTGNAASMKRANHPT